MVEYDGYSDDEILGWIERVYSSNTFNSSSIKYMVKAKFDLETDELNRIFELYERNKKIDELLNKK